MKGIIGGNSLGQRSNWLDERMARMGNARIDRLVDVHQNQMSCYGDDHRRRARDIPFPKVEGFVAEQAGMDQFPSAWGNLGGVIQEPVPEILIKFIMKHTSSAIFGGFQFGFGGVSGLSATGCG